MKNFTFYAPTKVVFGPQSLSELGSLLKKEACRTVLLHYGSQSVNKSGLLDEVKQILEAGGFAVVELGGVVPNPRLSLVYEGIRLGHEKQVDFILALGGGSVIDSAKAIAYGLANDFDVWDLYEGKAEATACLPLGCILTIAAAGSEMSNGSVITHEDLGLKRAYDHDLSRPRFSILNPKYTLTLPDYQTSCGNVDILMHTMERYLTAEVNLDVTDSMAEALLRKVMQYALVLAENPHDEEARSEIMWAGSLAHNGLTGCGGDGGDWSTHRLEHEVSALYDVAHGAGLAAIWGSWARYVYDAAKPRFRRFAVEVMGVADEGEDDAVILEGIQRMEAFYRQIQMPTNLRELGLEPTQAELEKMAKYCAVAAGGTLGKVKPLKEADLLAIYQMAR